MSYIERATLFFEANEITNENKQKAILLSSIGADTYNLLKSLLMPVKPIEKPLQDIIEVLKVHQNPKPNMIAERFKFNTRDRKEGESLTQYLAVLRRLTEHCNYGEQIR